MREKTFFTSLGFFGGAAANYSVLRHAISLMDKPEREALQNAGIEITAIPIEDVPVTDVLSVIYLGLFLLVSSVVVGGSVGGLIGKAIDKRR